MAGAVSEFSQAMEQPDAAYPEAHRRGSWPLVGTGASPLAPCWVFHLRTLCSVSEHPRLHHAGSPLQPLDVEARAAVAVVDARFGGLKQSRDFPGPYTNGQLRYDPLLMVFMVGRLCVFRPYRWIVIYRPWSISKLLHQPLREGAEGGQSHGAMEEAIDAERQAQEQIRQAPIQVRCRRQEHNRKQRPSDD
jgi:hypothetical protein